MARLKGEFLFPMARAEARELRKLVRHYIAQYVSANKSKAVRHADIDSILTESIGTMRVRGTESEVVKVYAEREIRSLVSGCLKTVLKTFGDILDEETRDDAYVWIPSKNPHSTKGAGYYRRFGSLTLQEADAANQWMSNLAGGWIARLDIMQVKCKELRRAKQRDRELVAV